MKLTDFNTLTFDCYGTLIDWESGICTALQPLLANSGNGFARDAALEAFARLAERGIQPAQILHTAQSLFHDHAPAKKVGLASCWIDRRHAAAGWGATMPPPAGAGYDFRFTSLAAMADAHRQETSA